LSTGGRRTLLAGGGARAATGTAVCDGGATSTPPAPTVGLTTKRLRWGVEVGGLI
jgi:hypothetical protein